MKRQRIKISKYHKRARALLKSLYPTARIYEETPIDIDGKQLYLDFYLPAIKLAIEVHGEQHYKYNSFFFNSKLEFAKAQKNDRDKKEWCKNNNITLIELPYNLKDEEWTILILN